MSTLYCTCGFKNEYSGVKPKFCGNCGQPFDKLFKAVVTPPPQPVNVPVTQPSYYQQAQVQYSYPHTERGYEKQGKDSFGLDPNLIKIDGESCNRTTLGELQKNKNFDFSRQSNAGDEIREVGLKPMSAVKNEYIEGMVGGSHKRRQQDERQAPRREMPARKTARKVSK